MADFHLQIFTQEKQVYDGRVSSIIVPGASGYLGVLANHAPLVALLGDGTLTVKWASGDERQAHLVGGFIEVHNNIATLLVDELGPGLEPQG